MNYYNEYEPFAVEWLKELIKDGLIPAGDVDSRSITEVEPSDLRGYNQCHFFAGIGGWAYAARLAGWADDRPMWTGSPPCQPFSVAGKRKGTDDERHLWPSGSILSESASLQSYLESKLAPLSGTVGLIPFKKTWKQKATPAQRRYCQLQVSALSTKGIGSGSWPTPAARDGKDGAAPSVVNSGRSDKMAHCVHLMEEVAKWLTPTTSDMNGTRKLEGKRSGGLNTQATQVSGMESKPSNVKTEKSAPSQLNPRFSLWLMGYPIAWAYCAERVTPLSRRSRQK